MNDRENSIEQLSWALMDITFAMTEHGDRVEFERDLHKSIAEAIAVYVDSALERQKANAND